MPKFYTIFFAAGVIIAGCLLFPTKTQVTQIDKVEVKKIEQQKHTHRVVVIEEKPDGTKKTVIQENTDTTTDSNVQSSVHNKTINEVGKKNSTRISVMTGVAPSQIDLFIYGVSVTKPILGPVSIGVWGFSNKTFGASVGIDL